METLNWIWPIFAALVSTIYFFLIKYYVITENPMIIAMVIALELLVIYLYYKALQYSKSGTMYAIINGFSVILGAMIAMFFLGEKLTLVDMFGIAIIIAGIMIVGKK